MYSEKDTVITPAAETLYRQEDDMSMTCFREHQSLHIMHIGHQKASRGLIRNEVEAHPIWDKSVNWKRRTGELHTEEMTPVFLLTQLMSPILLQKLQRLQHIRYADGIVQRRQQSPHRIAVFTASLAASDKQRSR